MTLEMELPDMQAEFTTIKTGLEDGKATLAE